MNRTTLFRGFQLKGLKPIDRFKRGLLLLSASLFAFYLSAQTTVVFNAGPAGSPAEYNAGPIYRSSSTSTYNASRYTYLYTAGELAAAGLINGSVITQVGWVKNNTAVANGPAMFNIYMKNSSAVDFSLASETWANLNTGATPVYQNNAFVVPATAAPNYITFTLTSPYVYTGGSLEISTEYDVNGVASPASSGTFDWLWDTVVNRIYGTGQTTLAGAGTLSSTTNSISTIDDRRPWLQMTFNNSACTSPPNAGTAVSDASGMVCSGSTVNLTLSGITPGVGQTYQWESATALAGPYAPFGPSLTSPYTTVNPTVTTYYRAVVTCGASNATSVSVQVSVAPLFAGGTYTVNPALPATGSNFQTLQAAVSAMACGIAGPVVFNVSNANYTGQLEFPAIGGTSAVNTITFNGNGASITGAPTSAGKYVVLINGTDYLTLDNFKITATDATYGVGVLLTNAADHNTVKNCIIDISAVTSTTSTNSAGIAVNGSITSTTSAGNNANFCLFSKNKIIGGIAGGAYYGITLMGNATGLDCQGNQIIDNTINNFYATGIYLSNTDGTIIRGNDIHRMNRQSVTTFAGVQFNAGNRNCLVDRNQIHGTHNNASSTSGTVYAIYFTSCDAPTGMANVAQNNLIYDLNTVSGTIYALYNSGSDGTYFYHNTVSLDFGGSTSGTIRGFYQTTLASDIILKNNLFSITQGGTGTRHALYFGIATSTIISDYNDLYVNAATGSSYVGYYSANQATLLDWKAVNSGTFDQNSIAVDPVYTSPANQKFHPTAVAANNLGTPIAGITTDFAGAARSITTPDMGALEFNPTNDDAGLLSVTGLSPAVCPGSTPVSVVLKNLGLNVLSSVAINWTVNGVLQPQVPFAGSLASGATTTVSLGSFNVVDGVVYNIKAWTNDPNTQFDVNTYNDSTMYTGYESALTGTYTVGPAGNFPSVVASKDALVKRGICGPVVFNVTNGIYPGIVAIPAITGSSATNTITYNGNGATISAATNSTERAAWRLEGADYVTIDNFKIQTTDATYGFGVQFMNGADYNTVKNCNIDVSSVTSTTSTNSGGIVFSNSTSSNGTSGVNGSFNKILNNTIAGDANGGPYYGIIMYGSTGYVGCENNEIRNNVIHDFYSYGIYMVYNNGTQISDNDISRPNKVSVTTFNGIYFSTTCKNVVVERNRLHNTHDAASSLTGSVYFIYSSSSTAPAAEPNIIRNNLMYNYNGTGGTCYAIYNSTSPGFSYYFNTISLDNAAATSGTIRGFYQTGTAADIILMNNNFTITYGGTGTKHGLYFATSGSTIVSNYNNIYVNSAGTGAQYVGYYTANQATLTDWQAVNTNAYDQNSISVDPLYTDLGNNDYKPTAAPYNNKGIPVTGITTDFANVTRHLTTPDIGAYEFSPVLEDAGISAISGINAPCPGIVNLTATVTNFGVLNINSVSVKWTVNNVAQTPVTFVGSLGSGQSGTVSLGNLNMASAVLYNIKAWTEDPNGNVDVKNNNDTTFLSAKTAMSGVYTVGPAGDYLTVADAADDLIFRGVCGPVTINVTNGVYNGRVTLNQVLGTSSVNTITFNGNGSTITHTPDATNYSIVNLIGTSYTSFSNFTVTSGSATYGYGFLLMAGSDHTTIQNCTIDMSAVTSTGTGSGGIIVSGSFTSGTTAGLNASDCVFQNNTITGGATGGPYYGITLLGTTGNVGCRRNTVINNLIRNTYVYNIYMAYTDSTWVGSNEITRETKTSFSTFYGIYMGSGNMNALIEKNRIHDNHTGNPTSTSSAYFFYTSSSDAPVGQEVYFINNLIYNVNGNGTTYVLYNVGSDGIHYYYNTISMDNPGASTSNSLRGFYQTTTASNVRLLNNIFSLTQGGSGTKYVYYYGATASSIISDHNVLYLNSTGSGAANVGYFSTDYATFASWQTANGGVYDQNSTGANPEFTNIALNNYTPNSFFVNKRAIVIPGVTTDIFGTVRSVTTPDAGAIEFVPTPTNDGCATATPVIAGVYPGSTINSTSDVAPTCVVANSTSGGVWYTYAGTGNFANFSLCGAAFDTRIRIFEGNCSSLNCVTGNEDFCATQSEAGVCSEIGKTYYILVHGNGSAEGDFNLTVTETPVQQGAITAASTEFCPGDSLMISAASASGYLWNDAAMSTTQDIYVTTAGSYYTVITDANGCQDTSNVLTVSNYTVVPPVVTTTGILNFCVGDSIELVSSSAVSYLWNDAASSTTPTIWTSVPGSYAVTVVDTNGCTSTSAPVNAANFPVPNVDLGADRVTCSRDAISLDAGAGFASYLWSTGATTQTINFLGAPGNHTLSVAIIDNNGCEGSDSVVVKVDDCTGIEEYGNATVVNVYPNPGRGVFTLEVSGFTGRLLQVNVSDFRGRTVYTGQLNNLGSAQALDLGELAEGVYNLVILGENQVKTTRLIVQ